MKSKHLFQAEGSSSDIISTLPESILETILCLLPTEDAARTSVLARKWRYKWTKIPKLNICLPFVIERTTEQKEVRSCQEPFDGLHKILALHKGPIQDFTLCIGGETIDDPFGFDHIIRYLLQNHPIKMLTLEGAHPYQFYNLPVSVFSFHHLTDLSLSAVYLDYELTFNGFSSLRSLVLIDVDISTKSLLHLLSNCPSLKSLTLVADRNDKKCDFIELFKCLPMIENLTTCANVFQLNWLVLDSVRNEPPTPLLHLKYLSFAEVCFDGRFVLAFLLVLTKCSSNVEKIMITFASDHLCDKECPAVWEKYSDVSLEHLKELEIEWLENRKLDLEFVKFILGKSPKLKKVSILWAIRSVEERLEITQVLLRASRASPVVIFF